MPDQRLTIRRQAEKLEAVKIRAAQLDERLEALKARAAQLADALREAERYLAECGPLLDAGLKDSGVDAVLRVVRAALGEKADPVDESPDEEPADETGELRKAALNHRGEP